MTARSFLGELLKALLKSLSIDILINVFYTAALLCVWWDSDVSLSQEWLETKNSLSSAVDSHQNSLLHNPVVCSSLWITLRVVSCSCCCSVVVSVIGLQRKHDAISVSAAVAAFRVWTLPTLNYTYLIIPITYLLIGDKTIFLIKKFILSKKNKKTFLHKKYFGVIYIYIYIYKQIIFIYFIIYKYV